MGCSGAPAVGLGRQSFFGRYLSRELGAVGSRAIRGGGGMQAMSGTGSTVGRSAVVVAGTVSGGGGVGVVRFRLPVLV